ncbi:hypothetical protein KBC04_03020 [Candidatus Babeliales bacterium]|nr:hypothetical protein [Candidatus Babeliales bacterium]MBP9843976.1 hypothetical protein [Candidatus Babeliales bacterium]
MKNKLILSCMMTAMMTRIMIASQGADPIEPIIYPPHYHNVNHATVQFDPEAPGFNKPDDNPIFHGVQPLPFKPEYQTTGAMYGSDKNMIGYFWNTKDNDPSIIYPGKARIGNDQFINVVIMNTGKIDQTGESDSFSYTNIENIYNLNSAQNKNFQPDFLVRIGTFIRKGITYDIYGQYMATVIPDQESVEVPLFKDVKN